MVAPAQATGLAEVAGLALTQCAHRLASAQPRPVGGQAGQKCLGAVGDVRMLDVDDAVALVQRHIRSAERVGLGTGAEQLRGIESKLGVFQRLLDLGLEAGDAAGLVVQQLLSAVAALVEPVNPAAQHQAIGVVQCQAAVQFAAGVDPAFGVALEQPVQVALSKGRQAGQERQQPGLVESLIVQRRVAQRDQRLGLLRHWLGGVTLVVKALQHRVQQAAVVALAAVGLQLFGLRQAQHAAGEETVGASAQRLDGAGADGRRQAAADPRQRRAHWGGRALDLNLWRRQLGRFRQTASAMSQLQPRPPRRRADQLIALGFAAQQQQARLAQQLDKTLGTALAARLGVGQPQGTQSGVRQQCRAGCGRPQVAFVSAREHDLAKRPQHRPGHGRDQHLRVGVGGAEFAVGQRGIDPVDQVVLRHRPAIDIATGRGRFQPQRLPHRAAGRVLAPALGVWRGQQVLTQRQQPTG